MSDETRDVPMPRIGEDEDEYMIVAWLKRPGDEIAAGEAIAEAMTEKANVEIESPVAGVLEEILVEEEGTAAVGQPIARVIEPEG